MFTAVSLAEVLPDSFVFSRVGTHYSFASE